MSDQIIKDDLMFVSIVGTQALGTLEPLLALRAKKGPMPIRLLYTGKTKAVAERLEKYIKEHNLGDVVLFKTGTLLNNDEAAPKILAALIEEAESEGRSICFNIDGGMNYQIAACMIELDKHGGITIQSTKSRAVITDLCADTHLAMRLVEAIPPEEILELQGTPFEIKKKNPDVSLYPFSNIIKEGSLAVPGNALKNVSIGGIVFDFVWNSGNNRLSFLKDWRFSAAPEEYKIRERDFAQWSKDRNRCGQLFDRKIYAVVWDLKSHERLNEDSNGQIETILYTEKEQCRSDSTSLEELKKIFKQKPQKVKEEQLKIPSSSPMPPLKDDTLIVAVGSNLNPTLLAIVSHQPKHVLLVFSRDDKRAPEYAERIRQYAGALGVQSVSFADFKLEGIYANQVLPKAEEGARVVVNISPGTKGQGAMLARWAGRNGFEVWSINGSQYECTPILAPEDKKALPLQGCNPATLFRILGRELLNAGKSEDQLRDDFEWLDGLLGFMAALDDAGLDIAPPFETGNLKYGDAELIKIDSGQWRLRFDGKEHLFIKENKGVWFEKLCARALMNAGAEHVRLNLALKWNEENEKQIRARHKESNPIHSTEFDVLGSYKGKLVLVSAKSCPLQKEKTEDCYNLSLDEAIQDVRDMSQVTGKFTLAILTHMGSTKASSEDRVAVLTWRDICHPERFAARIEELSRKQSTTAQEA